MDNISLVDAFSDFKEHKNIDRSTMMQIFEEVFRGALVKKFGTADNFDITVNVDKGEVELWRNRTIVDDSEVTDINRQIPYTEAIQIEPDFEIGEELSEEVKLSDFGRREIVGIKQRLQEKILDLSKDNIIRKYSDKIGDIITGEVHQTWKREILITDEEGIELILPKNEMIPSDFYRKGDTLRAAVIKVARAVESSNNKNDKNDKIDPVITLSRTANVFLEKLLESEVPEIFDGLITIKNIVRAPGERAKVAVETYDERIDPVGACVGLKGSRIHGIVRELKGESIDVVNFTNNTALYVQRSLSPAKISDIKIDEEHKRAEVYLKQDQVSLAIGKGGYNIKLAGKLTGYDIDVYRESETGFEGEDVDLIEFSDEIDLWVIEKLKSIGCDTAKSVLNLGFDDLMSRKELDLDEETVREIMKILRTEFE